MKFTLMGKQIIFMPSGATLQTMDMNQLLSQYAVDKSARNASASSACKARPHRPAPVNPSDTRLMAT